jgi:hypothetical protein
MRWHVLTHLQCTLMVLGPCFYLASTAAIPTLEDETLPEAPMPYMRIHSSVMSSSPLECLLVVMLPGGLLLGSAHTETQPPRVGSGQGRST